MPGRSPGESGHGGFQHGATATDVGRDPARSQASELPRCGFNLRRDVVELGVGEHRFAKACQRGDRAGTRTVQQPQTHLEPSDVRLHLLGKPHGLLCRIHVERHEHRHVTHHGTAAPINSFTDPIRCRSQ